MVDRAERQSRPRATQEANLLGQTLGNGEYTIEAVLGQGGMGRVFLASHVTLLIPLAIKQGRADAPIPEVVIAELDRTLHGEERLRRTPNKRVTENDFPSSGGMNTDRFLREALLLARLQHPSLPALYDYFFEDGYWYLVMDYIPGPTLMSYLHKEAPLPPLEALNYAMQLCDVLDYLHRQTPPVIFRDIKPSNIILAPNGRVMLVDFGIARYYKEGQLNDTTEFGSPGYAPPEQYQGEGQTDGRSDLYSLGVILHEMLSGQHPIGMGGKLESLHYLNPDISPVLSGLVSVATRTEPMYRFQSAHSFFRALEHAYSIEERRAYEQYVLAFAHTGELSENEDEQFVAPLTSTLQSASRISQQSAKMQAQTRSALQEARRDKIEKEHSGVHLTSVDESLAHRVSLGLTPMPFPAVPVEQRPQARQTGLGQAATPAMDVQNNNGVHSRGNGLSLPAQPNSSLPAQSNSPFPYSTSRPSRPSRPQRSQLSPRPQYPARSSHGVRRLVQTIFLLALVLFLVMFSLLAYNHFFRDSTHNNGTPTTGTVVTTSPQGTTSTSPTVPQTSWQILPSLPLPEADNTAMYVSLQGQSSIYLTAGYLGRGHNPLYDRGLYRYDSTTAHWDKLADASFPRMVNNAVAQDDQHNLFFTAGYSPDQSAVSSLLYMYQPTTGQLQKIVPPAQDPIGFGGAMIADQQGHLYITQGFMKAGNPRTLASNGWYRYDSASGQWHTLAPMPLGLGYVVLAPDGNGGILLLGGATNAGQNLSTMQIYRYNIATNTWT
ncbi:MAG TPA: serine/threonine-protein kinase, partial [Ktedonobacteraceae bacterium]|nr:serine/threonine-protein kinase [Ktedonobacteraceae bacterium]